MLRSGENNSSHCKTIFKQTFKFTKHIPEQRISPDGFLIRDCGCVMRFLPNLDKTLNKTKIQPTTIVKNQNLRNSTSHTYNHTHLNQTKKTSIEMNLGKHNKINSMNNLERFEYENPCNIQHTSSLYQSTFWMEPRIVPVKYTTELNFDLESPTKRFTEKIDVQMRLVPCPYIQQIGTTTRFKTSVETRIQSEYTLPLNTNN